MNAQVTVTPEAIQDSILTQLALFPQEKIHLHTDRTIYTSGEKIWFKAYVVDALTHALTYSQYVYIELINASDLLIHRVMVKRDDNGLFHGNLFLSESIPDGEYTLRAYTRFMENLGDDYFFKKPILIKDLISRDATKLSGNRSNLSRNNYEVSFFPEGGNLTEGAYCRVAFKALNRDGTSEAITGEIVDGKGNFIVTVNTVFAGMGSFTLNPEKGVTYFLNCRNQNGQEKRFKLPPAYKTWSMATSSRNNRHFIELKRTPDIPEQPLYLLIHCQGIVYYFDSWNHSNTFISLLSEMFPSGVLQVMLLDGEMNPVSERLIFNKNEDQVNFALSWNKPSYQTKERVFSEISVTDPEGNPLTGHVSVAITDDEDIEVDALHTITSSLLLSSELRGYIESPDYYLQNHKEAELALDHLMMTHGWRRYEISKAIKGNYQFPETEYEESKEISGLVRGLVLKRPVANAEVLFTANTGNYGETVTNSSGLFHFYLHYPDSVKFFVQAKNQKGNTDVELVVAPEKFPSLKHVPQSSSLTLSSNTNVSNQIANDASNFVKKAVQRAQYDENIRLIQLPEVTITATRINKRDELRLKNWTATGSDKTIYREEFENRYVAKVSHLLWGTAGVEVFPEGRIRIRGYDGSPIIFVDGIQWLGNIDELSVHEIESIDIHKGVSAAMFGMKGANGAISITLRRGEYSDGSQSIRMNNTFLKPLGYQTPVEFYAPQYDTPELRNNWNTDYRTTIFWKPDILVSDDGKASFEFYTSNFPTSYSVVVEGLSDDGKIIRQVEKIEVK